ncbi:MAG: TldD/PmbA family protein [Armatimonadetes bacterium]|nr:TldD/PmbA family protein [Armatimonadota bacterium]
MEAILHEALNRCEDAELFSLKVEEYPVHFEANHLQSIKSKLIRGIGLRVIHEGKVGFASDTEVKDPKAFVDQSIRSARLGPPALFTFWKGGKGRQVSIFDPRAVSFDIEESVELGGELITRLRERIPDIYCDLTLTKSFLEITLNTSKQEQTYYKSLFSLDLGALLVRDRDFFRVEEGKWGGEICRKIEMGREIHEMPTKKMPVIFTHKAVPHLLGIIAAGLNGRVIANGASPLAGRMGDRITSPAFTLYDDGAFDQAANSSPFDDEGVPRKRIHLIKRGLLKNYLLDLSTAGLLGDRSTGSASRPSYAQPPSPSPSTLVVERGDVSYEDMIQGLSEGLVVDQVIGGGQSNVLAGQFSVNVELGYRVQNGKIVGRVKHTMVAGNVYDLLSENLISVGRDLVLTGRAFAPAMCFKDVSVSGTK